MSARTCSRCSPCRHHNPREPVLKPLLAGLLTHAPFSAHVAACAHGVNLAKTWCFLSNYPTYPHPIRVPSGLQDTHPIRKPPAWAPSSDPRATHSARCVPFFQERTPNLTVWVVLKATLGRPRSAGNDSLRSKFAFCNIA